MDTSGRNENNGLGHVGPTVPVPIPDQDQTFPGGVHHQQGTTNVSLSTSLGHPTNPHAFVNPPATTSSPGPSGIASGSIKPRQLSETEWGGLKDLLHKYYIEENKTLKQVREAMLTHGFILTSKQLTSRFTKWGPEFKKNVKESETEMFLHSAAGTSSSSAQHQDGLSIVGGVRVTAAKRERWEKRLRIQQDSGEGPFRHDTTESTSLDGVIELPPTTTATEYFETPVARLIRLLSDLSLVSPDPDNLTRLRSIFESSAIEEGPANSEPPETISGEELLSLTKRDQFGNPTKGSHTVNCHWRQLISQTRIIQASRTSRKRTLSGTLTFPFKYPGLDADFPTAKYTYFLAGNPLNVEVYPFPSHRPRSSAHSTQSTTVTYETEYERLQKEVAECTERIRLLQAGSSESFPGGKISDPLLALTERLARAFFNLGHYREAEKEYMKLLPHLIKRHGPQSRYVLSVKDDLTAVILHQGRHKEAMQMAHEVYSSSLLIDTPGGRLIRNSLFSLAMVYSRLGNLDQAEGLFRQLLQMRLSYSGPRDSNTLGVVCQLCDLMTDTRRLRESEELLRVTVELGNWAKTVSRWVKCRIHRDLARVLYENGNLAGSEALYKKTINMAVELLGDEHLDTLWCRFMLCKVFRRRGKLQESYELLVKTVEQLIKTSGQSHRATVLAMVDMSCLLVEMGKMEEAEEWMRQALRCLLEGFGDTGIDEARAESFWADVGSVQAGECDDSDSDDVVEEESSLFKSSYGRSSGERPETLEQRRHKVMELYQEMKYEINDIFLWA